MASRILVTDSDTQILTFSLGALREHGFRVIVECSASEALRIAQQWLPDLIIAPASCLLGWASDRHEGLQGILPSSAFLLTTFDSEDLEPFQEWIGRRCEVLMKPLIHSAQLIIAVESAIQLLQWPSLGSGSTSEPATLQAQRPYL